MVSEPRRRFTIGHIANLLDIHPQTLRLYEREGFVTPARTRGNTRVYSAQDVERLRAVLHLTRDLGVNLAGVGVILQVQQKLTQAQQDIAELRQRLAQRQRQWHELQGRQRALIKASSRMLIKVS